MSSISFLATILTGGAKILLDNWGKGKAGKAALVCGGLLVAGTGVYMLANWWDKMWDCKFKKDLHDHKQGKKKHEEKAGLEEWLQDFKQAHRRSTTDQAAVRTLIYDWLIEGNDTGLLAPTDCGKTTYMMQVAMDLAAGHPAYPLTRSFEDRKPIRVVVFALEQSDLDIKTYYGDRLEKLQPMITIHAGVERNTPGRMLEIIKAELMAGGTGGVVVIIDNFTTLLENSNQKDVEQFCLNLDIIRQASTETDRPLTVVKVFHTKKNVRPDRRFDQTYFRGDGKYLYGAQNVLYLTYYNRGNGCRVQGYIKRKNGDKMELNLLRFTDNRRPGRLLYERTAGEEDLGMPNKKKRK